MDASNFALTMGRMASGEFRQLILSSPSRFGNTELACNVIRAVSHANTMARLLGAEEQHQVAAVASAVFWAANESSFAFQNEAASKLISLISHASSMARINADARPGIMQAVEPIVSRVTGGDPPATAQALAMFLERCRSIQDQIRQISHDAHMGRIARG